MTTSRVALLIGGPSRHHTTSRAVASDILELPAGQVAHLHPVLITPEGQWRFYPSALGYSADTPQHVLGPDEVLAQLPFLYDAALVTLTGEYASDGQLQRVLDRAGMPYQGTGPRASAHVWDTAAVYQLLRRVGFQIPSYLAMNRTEWVVARGRKLRQLITAMGTELVVKPNCPLADEAILVRSPAQLADAIEEMSMQYDRFIIQRRLNGVLIRVGLIETDAGVVPGQVIAEDGRTVSAEACLALQRTAMKVHQILGLRDYSLVEMSIAHGRIWVSGVETLPELTQASPFTSSITTLGWSYADLISHFIGRALNRPEVIELR